MILKALQIYLEYVNLLTARDTVTSLEKKIKWTRRGKRECPIYTDSLNCYGGKWGRAEMEGEACPAHPHGWRPVGSQQDRKRPQETCKTADHSQHSPYDTGEVSWDPWKYREEFVIGKNRMKLKLGWLSHRYQIPFFYNCRPTWELSQTENCTKWVEW